MIEAAHSNGLTKTSSIFESQIHALRGQLIDAEAALAKSSATRESRGILAKILPTIGRSYSLERKLIRSGLFDADWYKSEYPEVAESRLSAARHYLDEGYCRGSSISLVSRDWNCQIPSKVAISVLTTPPSGGCRPRPSFLFASQNSEENFLEDVRPFPSRRQQSLVSRAGLRLLTTTHRWLIR